MPCTSVLVDKVRVNPNPNPNQLTLTLNPHPNPHPNPNQDFITNHSANTLRQFIGRVARTGLAPYGVAQFEDDSFLPKMCGVVRVRVRVRVSFLPKM